MTRSETAATKTGHGEQRVSEGKEDDTGIGSPFSITSGCGCSFTDLFWHICGKGASRHPYLTVPPEKGGFYGRIMITVETFLRQNISRDNKDQQVAAPTVETHLWYGVLFAPFSLTYSTSCFWVRPLTQEFSVTTLNHNVPIKRTHPVVCMAAVYTCI